MKEISIRSKSDCVNLCIVRAAGPNCIVELAWRAMCTRLKRYPFIPFPLTSRLSNLIRFIFIWLLLLLPYLHLIFQKVLFAKRYHRISEMKVGFLPLAVASFSDGLIELGGEYEKEEKDGAATGYKIIAVGIRCWNFISETMKIQSSNSRKLLQSSTP